MRRRHFGESVGHVLQKNMFKKQATGSGCLERGWEEEGNHLGTGVRVVGRGDSGWERSPEGHEDWWKEVPSSGPATHFLHILRTFVLLECWMDCARHL